MTTSPSYIQRGREIMVGRIGASWCSDQSYLRLSSAVGVGDAGCCEASFMVGRGISVCPKGRLMATVLGSNRQILSSDMQRWAGGGIAFYTELKKNTAEREAVICRVVVFNGIFKKWES